jgi:alginate O-acetyltransferase complex protein AlgI
MRRIPPGQSLYSMCTQRQAAIGAGAHSRPPEGHVLFNSFRFIFLFLPAVLAAVMLAKRWLGPRAGQGMVLIASTVFYTWFRPSNLLYLAASIAANWYLARRMGAASAASRKRWLQLGLVANIGYLCTFKYVNFLLGTLPFTHGFERLIPDLEFPLGISFFTLTQVMYLVDVYERLVPAGTLFDHATFVSFFPYVISGPLARVKRMRHQFGNFGGEDGKRSGSVARGLYLFSLGLFKKAVCADTFAQVANYGFDTAQHRSALEVLIFALTYSMQLYFDFSGYSDMAIGIAEMLGIEIPRNFDAPFRSTSIIEFWQRWHISLSNFITTYLYTPLLRSFGRVSIYKAMGATLVAMTIAGLWHGPSWTFVMFGVLHGIALALNAFWRKRAGVALPSWVSWLLTFCFVNMAFIFFRAPTLAFGLHMLRELCAVRQAFGIQNLITMRANFSAPIFGPPILLGLVMAFYGKSSEQLAREFRPTWRTTFASGLALTAAMLFMNSQITASFIYFRF